MKYFNYIAIIVFSIFYISCSEKNNVDINQILGFDEQCLLNGDNIEVDSFKIINLEITENSLIDNIKRVECVDSIIFIQTDNYLLSFDLNGTFLNKYGVKGNGPGEYLEIYSFVIEKEKSLVLLVDEASSKVITYSLIGDFISENKYDRQVLSFWSKSGVFVDDDIILFTSYLFSTKNTIYSLFNIKNEHIDELYRFPVKTNNTAEQVGKSTVSQFFDTIRLVAPFDNNVYTLIDGKLSPSFKVKTKQRKLSRKKIQSIKEFSIHKYVEYMNKDYFTGFTGVFETHYYIMLEIDFGRKYFLISKKNMTGRQFNYSLSETQDKLPLLNIVSSNSEYLIGVLDLMRLSTIKHSIIKDTEDENLRKLLNYINDNTINSNPCLLLYKLR
jgi:hypothetical protein